MFLPWNGPPKLPKPGPKPDGGKPRNPGGKGYTKSKVVVVLELLSVVWVMRTLKLICWPSMPQH